MTIGFEGTKGLIIVQAQLWGPSGDIILKMALDTGATRTLVNATPLAWVGYDPALSSDRVEIATASGIEFAPVISIERIEALDHTRTGLAVVCHTLPHSTEVDGLLGLDFFRGQSLGIDFRKGEITLN